MMTIDYVSCRAGGKSILQQVSAVLHSGAVHVLLGPNGAGKSTLLRVLSGETRPDAGLVLFHNQELHAQTAAHMAMQRAVLTQQYAMNLPFTVAEVVMMGRYPHFQNQPGKKDHAVVAAALDALQLGHLAGRPFLALSGGEQQRVQLARVLAQLGNERLEEKFLLLDEPTASMDLLHQHNCLRHVKQLAAQGLTVITVLHDLNLAAQFADQLLLLSKGRMVAAGPPEAVLTAQAIQAVYGMPVSVLRHAEYDFPIVLPLSAGVTV